MALSSTESKYIALAKASAEAIWLRKLLHELGFPQANSRIIYSNSQSAIALSENPKFHSRSKHVDTQYHFTREKVLTQEIQLQYVQTTNMIADIFTKSLPKDKHYHCMSLLGMDLIPPSPTPAPFKLTALLTYTKPHYSSLLCGSISAMSLFHFVNSWSGRLYQPLTCILSKNSQSTQYFTDKTHLPHVDTNGETTTQGHDGLGARCKKYYDAGACFAKLASSAQDRSHRALRARHPAKRTRTRSLRHPLPRKRPSPDRGAQSHLPRLPRHPQMHRSHRTRPRRLLQSAQRRMQEEAQEMR